MIAPDWQDMMISNARGANYLTISIINRRAHRSVVGFFVCLTASSYSLSISPMSIVISSSSAATLIIYNRPRVVIDDWIEDMMGCCSVLLLIRTARSYLLFM